MIRIRKNIRLIIIICLVLCSAFCLILTIYETIMLYNEELERKQMAIELESSFINNEAGEQNENILLQSEENHKIKENHKILPQYLSLYQQNNDMYGWINIDDTPINYPVMHTVYEPEKYLRKNFNGEYSLSGQIFLDYRCTSNSNNLILYGHNMKNQTMFGSILNYQNKEYYEKHPIVEFNNLYEENKYQIISVFYDEIHKQEDQCFKYYNFINAETEEELYDFIREIKKKSLYDAGSISEDEDCFLTISTCEYSKENGRFVVVAQKM